MHTNEKAIRSVLNEYATVRKASNPHVGVIPCAEDTVSIPQGSPSEVGMAVVALSIKPGGCVRRIMIEGGIKTNGKGVPPIEMEGAVDVLNVGDGLGAGGGGF